MTQFAYTTNVPNPPNQPSQDVGSMQINTTNIASIIAVDHVGFNTPNGGYHTITHQTIQTVDPANIPIIPGPGIGQLYTKLAPFNSSPDAQLFYETPNGGISQLTGSASQVNGFQFIGGVILYWGNVQKPNSNTGVVTFFTPFPTAILNVSITMTRNQSVSGTDSVWINNGNVAPPTNPGISVSGFNWKSSSSMSSNGDGFFWTAIGY